MTNPFEQSAQYFPTLLQQTVYVDKYSRWNWDLMRREAWIETVDRSVDFLRELSYNGLAPEEYSFVHEQMLNLNAMPSMRLLAMAGPAARRNHISIYNCSALTLDSIEAFTEIMQLSMHGVGVGYSVENKYVGQLPLVEYQNDTSVEPVYIDDTTEGWVDALHAGLRAWFEGREVDFDYSFIRPAGSILMTKGGRASGPEPLMEAMERIREIVLSRQGQFLRPIDAHDIACWIASASISGGMRRSALIALFDAHDEEMLHAKDGWDWYSDPRRKQRAFANNSAVIGDDTSDTHIEWLLRTMDDGKSGEPGLFNRDGVRRNRPVRRSDYEFLTNPCGEVALRSMQTCNLSSAVIRAADDYDDLAQKVRAATIIGTIQSMADDFKGLRPQWRQNQIEERLLGVDLNGQMDNKRAQDPNVQSWLRDLAVTTNEVYAKKLGINVSASVTTVKPSGNSGVMLNAASGLHPRWSPYYIRHVKLNDKSPVRKLLQDQGVPMERSVYGDNAWAVPFPVKSPEGAVFRNQRSAQEQLDYWLQVRTHWTEHQPSVTITYRPEELPGIVEWVKANRELVAGLSFLPADDHVYAQAPYVEISREQYEELAAVFPQSVDFSKLPEYETEDFTEAAKQLACMSGICEI